VEDRIPRPGGDHPFHGGRVGEVPDDKLRSRQHGGPMADREIVEDDNLRAAFQQSGNDMAADESGAACHEITRSRHKGGYLILR
jgi:hypothetical protein